MLSRVVPAVAGLVSIVVFAVAPAHAQSLQLAESFPVDTSLDHPDIPDARDLWVEMISAAQTSIDLSQFYVSPKEVGKKEPPGRLQAVLDAIEAAAKRGVTVRFLIDAKFAAKNPGTLDTLARQKNVEIRQLDLSTHTGGVQHAKYFIVDGKNAWLGSQNFDWRSLEHITELGVRFDHPALVADLQSVFALDWALAGGAKNGVAAGASETPEKERQGPSVTLSHGGADVKATLVASPDTLLPPGVDWDLPYLIHAIDSARHRVHAQVMTYALVGYDKQWWDELDRALRRAAARGVSVQLIVADWSLHKEKQEALKSLQVMSNLDVRVVSIPQREGEFVEYARVVHAKYMVVDSNWAWVGTSNWSRDYFYGSRNVGLIVEGESFAKPLDAWFDKMWTSEYSKTIDPSTVYEAPRRTKE